MADPRYDVVLHVVFMGFVTSMIFSLHRSSFPRILGVSTNFQLGFYIRLILIYTSLGLRAITDYANLHTFRMWGCLLNEAAAILLLIGMAVFSIRKSMAFTS